MFWAFMANNPLLRRQFQGRKTPKTHGDILFSLLALADTIPGSVTGKYFGPILANLHAQGVHER